MNFRERKREREERKRERDKRYKESEGEIEREEKRKIYKQTKLGLNFRGSLIMVTVITDSYLPKKCSR